MLVDDEQPPHTQRILVKAGASHCVRCALPRCLQVLRACKPQRLHSSPFTTLTVLGLPCADPVCSNVSYHLKPYQQCLPCNSASSPFTAMVGHYKCTLPVADSRNDACGAHHGLHGSQNCGKAAADIMNNACGQRRLLAAAVSRSHDVKHLPVIVPHSCLPSLLAKCVPWRLFVIDRRWHEMEASCSCGCTAGPAVLKASIVQRKGSKFLSCILSFLTGDTMVSLPYLAVLPLCAINVHSAGSHVQASIRCVC